MEQVCDNNADKNTIIKQQLIIIGYMTSVVQTALNPSDYEFLLKSAAEGNIVSKAESLKKLNTLAVTDKKQFSIYAKRVVLIIQDMLTEPKEDINLLSSTLALEIINLNPREIEYYIRTKLLKNMVRNLGDQKPQIRKTSHYCLLAYVKTYKTFDQIIQVYLIYGIASDSWQLRQKSINSFQSILIMEIKFLNWSSAQFRKVVEQLLMRTKDQSQFVQKAAEQCLLSICKFEQVRNFSRKLSNNMFQVLKSFCYTMFQNGFLQQIKLYEIQVPISLPKNHSIVNMQQSPSHRVFDKANSALSFEKVKLQYDHNRQTALSRIQQIRKKTQTPMKQKQIFEHKEQERSLRKAQSVSLVPKRLQQQKQVALPLLKRSVQIQQKYFEPQVKQQKLDKSDAVAVGRKIMDDLRNQKDWKVRLEAIEELQAKFNTSKQTGQADNIAKTFLFALIKLLGDPNFKVALIALKIIQQILLLQSTNYSQIAPQIVDRITDGKIALRQNVSKLIRLQFHRTGNKIWIHELLSQLKKTPPPNSNIKQQILNIFSKITLEGENNENENIIDVISSQVQSIIEGIYPLMDDLKTKIKIKTLDLLILLSVKTGKIQQIKNYLALKLNQVYFEMYLQKISKQLKNLKINVELSKDKMGQQFRNKNERGILNHRYSKGTVNTTTTSLKKFQSSFEQQNNTARTSSFIEKKRSSYETPSRQDEREETTSLGHSNRYNQNQNSQRKSSILKSYRKKTFDYKSTQYSAFSNSSPTLPPFTDPDKELKEILVQIKKQDWQQCSEALTKLRRIIQNHSQLLTQQVVKQLVPDIMRLVESLRSNLSKNAVITLNQFCIKMKKMLDSDLDSIFSKLIKKTLDTNSFISEEVHRALVSVCSNCNQSRVVTLLTNHHTARAVPIKLSVLNVLDSVTFLPKFYDKQLQKIVTILTNFLDEGSLEVRQKAKNLLSSILCSDKGESMLRLIPAQHIGKLKIKQKKKSDLAETKGLTRQESSIQAKQQPQQSKLRKKKKEKITVFPEVFESLEGLLEQCESGDWKNREKNMSIIFETLIEAYPKQFVQHKSSGKVMDILSKQIGDPNTRVACNALKILCQMPTKMPQIIQHNLSVLINEVFNCFGSHKPQIKALSEELFNQICSNIEQWMLVQHLCNGALYGLQKSRPEILNKLTQILPGVYAKGNKKTLINKNVYPLINKLAEQNKPENLQGLVALLRTCDQSTNGEFLSSLKPKAIQFYNSEVAD